MVCINGTMSCNEASPRPAACGLWDVACTPDAPEGEDGALTLLQAGLWGGAVAALRKLVAGGDEVPFDAVPPEARFRPPRMQRAALLTERAQAYEVLRKHLKAARLYREAMLLYDESIPWDSRDAIEAKFQEAGESDQRVVTFRGVIKEMEKLREEARTKAIEAYRAALSSNPSDNSRLELARVYTVASRTWSSDPAAKAPHAMDHERAAGIYSSLKRYGDAAEHHLQAARDSDPEEKVARFHIYLNAAIAVNGGTRNENRFEDLARLSRKEKVRFLALGESALRGTLELGESEASTMAAFRADPVSLSKQLVRLAKLHGDPYALANALETRGDVLVRLKERDGLRAGGGETGAAYSDAARAIEEIVSRRGLSEDERYELGRRHIELKVKEGEAYLRAFRYRPLEVAAGFAASAFREAITDEWSLPQAQIRALRGLVAVYEEEGIGRTQNELRKIVQDNATRYRNELRAEAHLILAELELAAAPSSESERAMAAKDLLDAAAHYMNQSAPDFHPNPISESEAAARRAASEKAAIAFERALDVARSLHPDLALAVDIAKIPEFAGMAWEHAGQPFEAMRVRAEAFVHAAMSGDPVNLAMAGAAADFSAELYAIGDTNEAARYMEAARHNLELVVDGMSAIVPQLAKGEVPETPPPAEREPPPRAEAQAIAQRDEPETEDLRKLIRDVETGDPAAYARLKDHVGGGNVAEVMNNVARRLPASEAARARDALHGAWRRAADAAVSDPARRQRVFERIYGGGR